jgi:hypothetical protein
MTMNFSVISYSNRWWNLGFICECWNWRAVKAVDAHIHQTSWNILKKRLPESCWQRFSRTEKSADGEIHATRDHNNVRSVLWNTNKLHRAIQNKRHGMLRSSIPIVLLHDNMHLHAATCTQTLLEHFITPWCNKCINYGGGYVEK